uniref:Scavenger receptor class B member 1 n=1 Tax=Panagrellus redivivus TaxID=6233 RepID=A0A7E4VJE5_PANRE
MVSLGCKIGYIAGLSIVLLLGIVLLTVFPLVIYPALVKPKLKLEESSGGMPTKTTWYWQNPPADFSYNFYMFNVTNPDEASYGSKVAVNEIGPYVWREWESKDTEFSADKTLVAFKNEKAWHFDEAASCASCKADDVFYQPTLSLLATANAAILAMQNMTSTQKFLIDAATLLMGCTAYK